MFFIKRNCELFFVEMSRICELLISYHSYFWNQMIWFYRPLLPADLCCELILLHRFHHFANLFGGVVNCTFGLGLAGIETMRSCQLTDGWFYRYSEIIELEIRNLFTMIESIRIQSAFVSQLEMFPRK